MIPDEVDPEIDFSWFYFIGKAKLGLTMKEVGHLSLTLFNKLYKNYKNDFDMELRLKQANMTYAEAYIKAQKEEEWL